MNKKEVAKNIAILGGLAYIAFNAFPIPTRRMIRERAGNASELSGDEYRPLECMHLNHNKNHDKYNKPELGLLVTDIEHLAYHVMYKNNPEKIGLNVHNNNFAIRSLAQRVNQHNYDYQIEMDLEEQVNEKIEMWQLFFEQNSNDI